VQISLAAKRIAPFLVAGFLHWASGFFWKSHHDIPHAARAFSAKVGTGFAENALTL
jgi:hypothetical protein